MRLKALAEHFPQRLGFVTDWKLLGQLHGTVAHYERSGAQTCKTPSGFAARFGRYPG